MFLGLIPARGGSKAIPNKNIHLVGGKPLLAWTAEAALASSCLDRVIVSTDDAAIASCARDRGLEVPFLRPAEIADDVAPMIGVLRHALDWWHDEAGCDPEGIVLLQPTSPLRQSEDIDAAVACFRSHAADSVVSVIEVPHQFSPVSVLTQAEDGSLRPFQQEGGRIFRRQDKPRVLARNGPAVLVLKPELVRMGQLYTDRTFPYLMHPLRSYDIDSTDDLPVVEALLVSRSV
ncbi:acylneuraminate cytidylyltransferase family protein [Akkermansiaceae bacterium]|nr:acylneuraminate cytidylyltransferase family protein [Akkermansiaceae bacterium]MDA7875342.1 acylneuraminate cytidylyltransferase family protein [Akkermansiaceae bacterium]MDA7908787.1 acylneuraminate cytidylyltransferase family protein [Akkermansiaceae bacterium]MDC0301385.1 acylneuraminate cytidylyltransferase family protein [Akkermansiaceae bacterium]